jgi:hypothetical protein
MHVPAHMRTVRHTVRMCARSWNQMDSTIEHSTRIINEQGHFQSYSYANDYNAMKETVHCMYVRYRLHIAHTYV